MNTHQVARAGEHFVAAELHRRGAYAVTFAGNMPDIDVLATNLDQSRTVAIQVKTRRSGTWHTSITRGRPRTEDPAEGRFWVFVDLAGGDATPAYYVVPEWWIQNDVFEHHEAYKKLHGGTRPRNPDSTHHKVSLDRIAVWRDRWDVLALG